MLSLRCFDDSQYGWYIGISGGNSDTYSNLKKYTSQPEEGNLSEEIGIVWN